MTKLMSSGAPRQNAISLYVSLIGLQVRFQCCSDANPDKRVTKVLNVVEQELCKYRVDVCTAALCDESEVRGLKVNPIAVDPSNYYIFSVSFYISW